MAYRILVINPGSTSTKVGAFEGEKELFSVNVSHDAEKLKTFATVSDQLPYRKETILKALKDEGIDLSSFDAFVGRGGGLLAVEGGTYKINDILLDHAERGANGIQHPAQLGSQLANGFAVQYGKPAFVVNPPDTDEIILEARMTGLKGVYRNVHLHALNLKETAIRHSAANGWKYEDKNYIVCHIGGGISISAHRKGKMIDGNDIVGGHSQRRSPISQAFDSLPAIARQRERCEGILEPPFDICHMLSLSSCLCFGSAVRQFACQTKPRSLMDGE